MIGDQVEVRIELLGLEHHGVVVLGADVERLACVLDTPLRNLRLDDLGELRVGRREVEGERIDPLGLGLVDHADPERRLDLLVRQDPQPVLALGGDEGIERDDEMRDPLLVDDRRDRYRFARDAGDDHGGGVQELLLDDGDRLGRIAGIVLSVQLELGAVHCVGGAGILEAHLEALEVVPAVRRDGTGQGHVASDAHLVRGGAVERAGKQRHGGRSHENHTR